jgi:hypothetical protein
MLVSARSLRKCGRWSVTLLAAFRDHRCHLPASCGAAGRNALSLAVELLAGRSRRDTGRDHHLLRADGVRRRRRVDNHRPGGQLLGREFPTLPQAPGGLRAEALVRGVGGQVPADRRTRQRAFVNYPTIFDQGLFTLTGCPAKPAPCADTWHDGGARRRCSRSPPGAGD